MRTTTALLIALSTSLAACGGGNPKEDAFAALNSGDFAGAIADFDKAMDGVEQGSSEHIELAVGRCEALAHTDAEAAKNAMIALAEAHKDGVKSGDYKLVASKMVDAKNFEPAIHLLDDGIKNRFPSDSEKLTALIETITMKAEKSGDAGALSALKGLGYVGGE